MFIPPMLLVKRESPFDDARYTFEPKIDGHRMLIEIQDGRVRLYTRHHNDCTRQYPELHDVPIADNSDVILDGEVAIVNPETGAIEFESVMERFMMRTERKIVEGMRTTPVHFFAFDILRYKSVDLRGRPLSERKAILAAVLGNNAYFSRVMTVEGDGRALFQAIEARGMEGIVAKRTDSVYVSRRDSRWLKIINYTYADVKIAGFRRSEFGWLAQFNGKPAGIIELAVPAAHKTAFYNVARGLMTGEDREFVYVEPRIGARVRFRNWTRKGLLRSPEFVSFVV